MGPPGTFRDSFHPTGAVGPGKAYPERSRRLAQMCMTTWAQHDIGGAVPDAIEVYSTSAHQLCGPILRGFGTPWTIRPRVAVSARRQATP